MDLGFKGGASGKESTCQCKRYKRFGFNPWVRKMPWRRAWQPARVSLLENPVDRGAWQAMVHWVAKSRTRLKRLSTHVCKSGPTLTVSSQEEEMRTSLISSQMHTEDRPREDMGTGSQGASFRRDQSRPQADLGLPASGTVRKGISAV